MGTRIPTIACRAGKIVSLARGSSTQLANIASRPAAVQSIQRQFAENRLAVLREELRNSNGVRSDSDGVLHVSLTNHDLVDAVRVSDINAGPSSS